MVAQYTFEHTRCEGVATQPRLERRFLTCGEAPPWRRSDERAADGRTDGARSFVNACKDCWRIYCWRRSCWRTSCWRTSCCQTPLLASVLRAQVSITNIFIFIASIIAIAFSVTLMMIVTMMMMTGYDLWYTTISHVTFFET